MTMPADSFTDPVHFNEQLAADEAAAIVAEMTAAERVGAFIEGMRLNAIDLLEFRCDPKLRPFFAAHEDKIRQSLDAIQLVLTSINIEHSGPNLRVVK